jgi:hypothetical protein
MLLVGSVAVAQSNASTVIKWVLQMMPLVVQAGLSNVSDVSQRGTTNTSDVNQLGQENKSTIKQLGSVSVV